jgi:hypothetical protein
MNFEMPKMLKTPKTPKNAENAENIFLITFHKKLPKSGQK